MGRTSFVFEGLVEIEDRVRRLAGEVGYLAVSDRTDRSNEEQLGRFDFAMKDALPYLEADARGSDEPEPGLFGYDEPVDEPEDQPDESAEPVPDDLAVIASAGCRWLRDIAQRNTVGEAFRRFRVKAYSHKGLRVVDTASFVCRNTDHDLDLPLHAGAAPQTPDAALAIPTPSFDEVAAMGASRGFKVLGDYYAQWGQIVLGSVGQLQGLNNAMTGRLHKQLQESRDQIDQLVASILEFRVAELRMTDERRSDQRAEDNRTELAKHALQQLGDMAKSLLAARGIPAELSDVLGAIGQSPALVGALNEPDVRSLMQDPQNLELLAGILRQAGQQARLLRDAGATQPHTS